MLCLERLTSSLLPDLIRDLINHDKITTEQHDDSSRKRELVSYIGHPLSPFAWIHWCFLLVSFGLCHVLRQNHETGEK